MRFKSAGSVLTDAYRAGAEIGASLREIAPDVVILFASISYEQEFSDLDAGLRDGLGAPALVFGGTGDGIYETGTTANYGVCALGIRSGDGVRFATAVGTGVSADGFACAKGAALQAMKAVGGPVSFAFVLADGVKADGAKVLDGFASVLPGPFFGGLTGDDRKFTRSRLFVDGKEYEDAAALLVATGPVRFGVNAASGWTPVGEPGTVDASDGNTVQRISGSTALNFAKDRLGKPLGEADLGIVPFAAYDASGVHFVLRSPSGLDDATGAISTFGSIPEGTVVRVCAATRDEVLGGVQTAVEGLGGIGFRPKAAIIVSCAGRKWLLDDPGREEVSRVLSALGGNIPLVGFPSFGEIAPFLHLDGSYSAPFFHNGTFVVVLLGE